jgi:hypothetical protein
LKKRRRIEVLIERRELSIYGISPFGGDTKIGGFEGERPLICATCGSTEMLRLTEAMTLIALDPVPAGSSAERSNVHCTFSASDECWVCKPSLHLG